MVVKDRTTAEAIPMLPTEDLFVYVYVLIHDLITAGLIAIPQRPGPEPGCSDAELLTIVMVRHLLGRRSEAAFLAELALRHRAADLLDPHPRHRDDVLPTCQRYGMGVLSYSPLAGGWLSGRYRQDATEGPASVARQRLANRFDLDLPDNQRKLEAAGQLAQLADDAGINLIELAIAFVLRHPAVTSAIIGPRTPWNTSNHSSPLPTCTSPTTSSTASTRSSPPASPSTPPTTAGSAPPSTRPPAAADGQESSDPQRQHQNWDI
jgi:hypothetical protein